MLKHLFFAFIILMLQSSSNASDEFDEEDIEAEFPEVVDSFPRTYGIAPYPWQLLNFASYQPRRQIQQNADDDEESNPHADPRFVTDRCHSRHSYTTTSYPCSILTSTWITTTTTTVTVVISNTTPSVPSNIVYEITSPTGFDPETTPLPSPLP